MRQLNVGLASTQLLLQFRFLCGPCVNFSLALSYTHLGLQRVGLELLNELLITSFTVLLEDLVGTVKGNTLGLADNAVLFELSAKADLPLIFLSKLCCSSLFRLQRRMVSRLDVPHPTVPAGLEREPRPRSISLLWA